ncbi:MAG TPA: CPBP family glutamic-type intramembrane protease [Planctomycetota bacterium]|nr:CPBP family glutamic-type intramembrane protease [Planctomycetota bacterium]
MAFLRWHREAWSGGRPLAYAWWIGVESTIVGLIPSIVLGVLLREPEPAVARMSMPDLILAGLVLAPVFETLLLQWLPITLGARCGLAFTGQVVLSTALFTAAHLPGGIAVGVAAGLVGGLYFAIAFARWRTRSSWTACWVTALAHAIHNAIVIALVALAR